MDKSEKYSQFILKLIELTSKGKLVWSIDIHNNNLSDNLLEDEYIEESFFTQFDNKHIRLIKKKIKRNYENAVTINLSWGTKKEWDDLYTLELYDKRSNISLYKYPISNSSLKDLVNSIKNKLAGADDFVDKILKST